VVDLLGALGFKASATPDDTLKLMVNGKGHEGWTQVVIKRSMKAIAGSFSLSVSDRWAEEKQGLPVVPGDECRVQIGTDVVITGYVDAVETQIDSSARSITISGRDKTADLVDCSVEGQPSQWKNLSLKQLLQKLATPFGVDVTLDATLLALVPGDKWTYQPGESVFENMDRAARVCGVLLMNTGNGKILVTRAGSTRAATELVQGENILTASASFDQKGRYSVYKVKSQAVPLEGDDGDPAPSFGAMGTATDAGVTRYRPLVIMAESAANKAMCQKRAQWEVAVRTGKGSRVAVKVPGWRQGDGKLWQVNQLTKVNAPWLGINIELLITDLSFTKGDGGTFTDMQLEPVQAYTENPKYQKAKDPWRQLVIAESRK